MLFICFLVDIVGKEVMEIFRFIYKYDFINLLRNFEVKKRIISLICYDIVIFIVLVSLLDIFFEKILGCNIMVVVLKFKYKSLLIWKRDKFWMEVKFIKMLFDEICK